MINQFPAGKLWDEYDKAMSRIVELEEDNAALLARAEAAEAALAEAILDHENDKAYWTNREHGMAADNAALRSELDAANKALAAHEARINARKGGEA